MNDKTDAAPLHDSLRDLIGQAISDEIAAGAEQPDWCDSREIDRLADAVLAVLPVAQAQAPVAASEDLVKAAQALLTEHEAACLTDPMFALVEMAEDDEDAEVSAVLLATLFRAVRALAAPQQHAQAAQPFASGAMQAMADAGLDVSVDGKKVPPRGADSRVTGNAQAAQGWGYAMIHKAGADRGFSWKADDPLFSADWQRVALAPAVNHAQAALSDEQIDEVIAAMGWDLDPVERNDVGQFARAIIATCQPAPVASVPAVVMPRIPTEAMLDAARDWSVGKYGIGVGSDGAIGCWQSMFDAAPQLAAAPVAAAVAQGDAVSQDAISDEWIDGLIKGQKFNLINDDYDRSDVHRLIRAALAQRAASQPARPAYIDANGATRCSGCQANHGLNQHHGDDCTLANADRPAPTAQQERAWFKNWVAGLDGDITVDQIEFGRRAWAERARRAAEGGGA